MRLWLLTRRITHLPEKVTGFAEKHFTSPHRAVASGFSASPSSSKLQIFHTCISWHNLSRLPFLLTSSIPEIEVIPQPLGSPLLPSFTWGGLFIRRFCEFGFGFWRDAALYDPSRPSFTSKHCDPLFGPFQLFLFCRFFTSASFLFLNLLCFWPLGFSSSVFLFCRHLLLFDSFSSYVMNFFLLGLFFSMYFSFFPVVYLLVFPSWNHFSLSPKKSVSFMLVLSLPFSFCFDLSTKYLVSFAQFFLVPFFLYSAYFLVKKMGDGLMQRMSRGRDQWQLIVHRLHSLNNVTARGSDEESFQSRNAIFDAWKKSGSPGNKKLCFFHVLFKKKKELSKWVKEKQCFQLFGKKRFQTRHSFSKRMGNKTRE